MEKGTIIGKYEVKSTLYADEFQSVYICELLGLEDGKSFIVNEYTDEEIISETKDSFIYDKETLKLIETFESEGKFYAVFPGMIGAPLDAYISKHNLTISDRMYFADGIFKKFIEIDRLHYAMQHTLCDLKNLSVQSRRFFHFNNIFAFKKENLKADSTDVIKAIGHLLLCIFTNKVDAETEKDKDFLPPAILPITVKCIEGGYNSLGKAYADFRNTLIYSTFVDSGSLDNQIRGRMVRAQKKKKHAIPKAMAFLLILLILFGGGFWLIKNKDMITGPGKGISIIGKKNNPPIADFSISINKVYKDDEVKFIDKSVASNPGDVIKSRLWTIEKDGSVIMNSEKEFITYAFDETGEYRVSLIAQDSRGVHSKPFTHSITVLDKPVLPVDEIPSPDNSYDRK